MNQTDNYGYILIDTPEKKRQFSPTKPGDEFLQLEGFLQWSWEPIVFCGGQFGEGTSFRRPIDPGEGYEIVPLDGTVTPDCEVSGDDSHAWAPQFWAARNNAPTPAHCLTICDRIWAFRRKKAQPLTLPMLQSAAHKLLNAIGTKAGHKEADDFKLEESRKLAQLINWKAPKSADEVAFEKWKHGSEGGCLTLEEAFKSGAEYVRQTGCCQ